MGVVKVAVRIGDWTDNKNMMLKKSYYSTTMLLIIRNNILVER